MTSSEAITLKLGQAIVVEYGRNGSQYARVVGFNSSRRGVQLVRVRKFRENSRRWTKPVLVRPDEILFAANSHKHQVPQLPLELETAPARRFVNDPDYRAGFNAPPAEERA